MLTLLFAIKSPLTHKPPEILHLRCLFIFIVGEHRDIKFVALVTIASPNLRTTKCPWKGRGHVTWPISNF